MLAHIPIALAYAVAASAAVLPRTLQACSQSVDPPCTCPTGTTLQQSTTRAFIKANVADVVAIIGSYQNTSWFGHDPDYVTGPDNTVGSSRTLTGGTPGGPMQFTEALFDYESDASGFRMAYYLENAPVTYVDPVTSQTGSYAGYWDFLIATAYPNDMTHIKWGIYACFTTDEVAGIEFFHESALNNVNDILVDEQLSDGFIVSPWTVEVFRDY